MTAVTEDVNVERKAVPGGCGEPLTRAAKVLSCSYLQTTVVNIKCPLQAEGHFQQFPVSPALCQ